MTASTSRTLAHQLAQNLSAQELEQVAGGFNPNGNYASPGWNERTLTNPFEFSWQWNESTHSYQSQLTIVHSSIDNIVHG
ncbi:hypothetical protein [Leeia aquatica]|uniref:Uncharacterized protein n=1 Tax=Leeia aquatica TaxID=2725557 RepID=A0A847SB94_9NEIS|nr:hypothetical protein [Leeia aquatica]NLR74358.1 hypothetical protein [Leeia aquatica]